MPKNFKSTLASASKGSVMSNLIPTNDNPRSTTQLEEVKPLGRKPRADKDNKNASAAEKGTKPGEMRKTYLVAIDIAEDLEAIAYWERQTIKDVVNKAFSNYVSDYALNNKAHALPSLRIKPIPKK